MFLSTTLTRFRRHLLLGAVAAAAIVPAAGAVTRPPDVRDVARALGTSVAGPDVLERYAIAHPFGTGLTSTEAGVRRPPDVQDAAFRSSLAVPDVLERYAAAHPYGIGQSPSEAAVSRPPDIEDAALTAQYSSFSGSSSSFNWSDWAIGIGTGVGVALLLSAGFLTSRQVRQRVRTA